MFSPDSFRRWCCLFVVVCCGWGDRAAAQSLEVLNPAARNQIAALQAEKAARSPARRKMDSRLVQIVRKQRGEAFGAGLERFAEKVRPAGDGRELVDIRGRVDEALLTHLRAIGAEIVSSVPKFDAIRARVPWTNLETLADRAEVQFVKPAAQAITNVGSRNSEGDQAHGAPTVRTNFRATGRGLKVGVLSDSVDFLPLVQATGDLGDVTILPGQDGLGRTGEGTAMLEIIHDLAPDAELFFGTAFLSEAQFAQNILDLRRVGCDIIVDDVAYFDESPFMDGPVARAVDAVAADGALYFSSAGNEGNANDGASGTWEGDFADGGAASAPINANGRLHDFGGASYNLVTASGLAVTLFWADPYGGSDNDYDLYLLDASGSFVLASSTNVQTGTQDPFELIEGTMQGQRLVIVKAAAAEPRYLHLKNIRGRLGQATAGACAGHAAANGALAVAAVNASTAAPNLFSGGPANPVENFSSDGLRRVFFFPDGTPITPGNFSSTGGLVRQKPDIAAADGVQTATPGFEIFFGTSAAAPHAGAIAALVWSYNRGLTAPQVRQALVSTALDIEAPGVDRDAGIGIVMPQPALQTVTPGPIVALGGATISSESFVPANGRPDPGETVTLAVTLTNVGAAAGPITATLLPTGGVSSPSAPQSYGILAAQGGQATRSFTFTANGAPGGPLEVTLAITSGEADLGTLTVSFVFGSAGTPQAFPNLVSVALNDDAAASPYPSEITLADVPGTVGKVTVQLLGLTHTYPSDLSFLLVSPSGRAVQIMNGVGNGLPVNGVNLTLDDAAAAPLPNGQLTSGTFRPTQLDPGRDAFPTPAPAGPYAGALSAFEGDLANGTWSLYAIDSYTGDLGTLSGGWRLVVTPASAAINGAGPDLSVVVTPPESPLSVGDVTALAVQVFNNGPAEATGVTLTGTLPAILVPFGGTISQGSGSISGQLVNLVFGTIPAGGSARLILNCNVKGTGTANLTFFSGLNEADNNPANNSGSASVTVGQADLVPGGTLVVSTEPGTSSEAPQIGANNLVYLDFTVANVGTGPASQPFLIQVLVDEAVVRTVERPLPLPAGETVAILDLPLGPLPVGPHTVRVRVDASGTVPETNEANNEAVRTIAVAGPNLAPANPPGAGVPLVLSKQPGTRADTPVFQAGDPIYVDFGVTNNGDLVTGVVTRTRLYLNGTELTTPELLVPATLAPGEQLVQDDLLIATPPPGTHTLQIVLDADNQLAETNEADNAFSKILVVNAQPTITAPTSVTIDEDSTTGFLAFTVGDAETPAGNLTLSAEAENGTVVFGGSDANRTVQFTPAPNAFGTMVVSITVADEGGGRASVSFQVTVNPVNDPPSFVAGGNQAVLEDVGEVVVPGWATAISAGPSNETDSYAFVVSTDNPGLFSSAPVIDGNGTLRFRPAPNANGVATVTVQLRDDGSSAGGLNLSPAQTFTITVLAVNDPPAFVLDGDLQVPRDGGPQTIAGFATDIRPGPADEAAQTVSFAAVAADPALFAVAPFITNDGTLTFTPRPTVSGSTVVTVTATDSAGATSLPQTFILAITSFAEEAGSYQGLVHLLAGAGSSVEQVGAIALTVRGSGRATGSVRLAGKRYRFKAIVQNDGQVRFGSRTLTPTFELRRRGRPSLTLSLQLDVAGADGRLSGTIIDGAAVFAGVTGYRVAYDRRNPAPAAVVGPYTGLFPHRTGVNNGVAPEDYPQGDGFATLQIGSRGTVRLRGRLADGKSISAGGNLLTSGRWALFAPMERGRGAISGFVDFVPVPGVSDAEGDSLLWFKPAVTREPRYPLGWPGGILVDFVGSKFSRSRGESVLPELGPTDANGNAEFRATDGGLAGPLAKMLNIDPKNRVTVFDPEPVGLRLRINSRSGVVTGRFTPPGARPVTVFGAVFQQQPKIGGFFLGAEAAGAIEVRREPPVVPLNFP